MLTFAVTPILGPVQMLLLESCCFESSTFRFTGYSADSLLSRGAFLISEPAKLKPYFPCSLAAKHAPGCIPHALAWTWRTGVWHRSLGVLLDKPTGSEATAAPPFPSSSAEILSDGGQGAFAILVCCLVTQSCPTLCDPMDCNLPGFSVHGIFQARVLEWVAISYSRVFS